jgi:hypothetical protein
VRLVLAPNWWSAADILIEASRRTAIGRTAPFVRRSDTPKEARALARSYVNDFRDKGEPDLADGWRLLAVDPTDRDEIAWVIDELTILQRAAAPPSDLAWALDVGQAITGWQMLAVVDMPLKPWRLRLSDQTWPAYVDLCTPAGPQAPGAREP